MPAKPTEKKPIIHYNMKHLINLLSLLLICLAAISLSNCGNHDPIPSTDNINEIDFIGTWADYSEDIFFILNSDNHGYIVVINDDKTSEQSIIWYYSDSHLTLISSGSKENMHVDKISKNLMILTTSRNLTYTFTRIKKSDIPGHESDEDEDNDGNNNKEENGEEDNNGEVQATAISTLSAEPSTFKAMLSGRYNGNRLPEVVGFEYSYDSTFPSKQTATVTMEGKFGGFEIEASRIVDQIQVYYRAIAVINGETIYGQTKSFTTPQATYSIDGKTYKFIKVTGLATGSFSMMQTELPPSAEIEVDGSVVKCLDLNNDNQVTKGEMIRFLSDFLPAQVRYPTPEEWLYAASGGSLGNDFKYSGSNDIDEVAWYADNSNNHARKPAQKQPNELGFYDMSGNYAELSANFDYEQLEDIIEQYVKKFSNSISAYNFNITWAATGGVFGGYWASPASKCLANSSEPSTNLTQKNYFDCTKYTIRLVYSRPD